MLKAEYDYATDIKVQREEAWENGVEQGIEQGIHALILDNLEDGKDEQTICVKLSKRFGLSCEEAKEKIRYYQR